MNCCLTVAGSDSGGNAGVQADLRAFHAYGLHGCTVFAALTAQNPHGVSAVHAVPPDFVAAQLDAVLGVYSIAALKTGMLADAAVIEVVADRLAAHPQIAKVIDPVMVATSGAKLIADGAVETLKAKLLPLATVITPNLPEAEVLSGMRIASRGDVREAAKRLYGEYGCAVLVKGGHAFEKLNSLEFGVPSLEFRVNAQPETGNSKLETRNSKLETRNSKLETHNSKLETRNSKLETRNSKLSEDTLFDGSEFHSVTMQWIENPISTHGTGCTLAAALAAELALGRGLAEAVRGAKGYVHRAISSSYYVGEACGVLGF